MKKDGRIKYNSDGSTAAYTYSAAGDKLGVRYVTANSNVYEAYCGNFIYRAGSLKRVLVDGGYITLSGSTPHYHFYLRDHLGNNRAVVNASKTVEEVSHYYPYGGLFGENAGSSVQPYKYNGKELDRMNGLDWYDYGARHMDGALGRFTTMDPLYEKYYSISPYAYCGGNPVNRVDIDGRDIVIVGPLANMAIEQLQEKIGNKIQLSLSNDNYLCYNIVGKGHLNKSAKRMIEMIDNHEITINMTTTDNDKTSTGELLVGGAFMGNNVELDSDGNVVHTTAYQEVNPQVLMKADTYSDIGTSMMHELTEAYEGAKISAENKVSSPKTNEPNSVFKKAHSKATTLPRVYSRIYDINGKEVSTEKKGVKAVYFVKPYETSENETIIQISQ